MDEWTANAGAHSHGTDGSENELLERAIAAVVAHPPPTVSSERVLGWAAGLQRDAMQRQAAGIRSEQSRSRGFLAVNSGGLAVAVMTAAMLLAGVAITSVGMRNDRSSLVTTARHVPSDRVSLSLNDGSLEAANRSSPVEEDRLLREGLSDAAGDKRSSRYKLRRGGRESLSRRTLLRAEKAGVSRGRRVGVAARAPVIVSTGRKTPIRLGEWVPADFSQSWLHVWDFSKSRRSRVLEVEVDRRMVVSPDGRRLVALDGRMIDLHDGGASRIGLVKDSTVDAAFSPDGTTLALLDDLGREGGRVRLIDLPTGGLRAEFPASERYKLRIAFTDDGTEIVLGGPEHRIHRRSTRDGRVIQRYDPPLDPQVLHVAVSPEEGDYIAAARQQGPVFVWDAVKGRLLSRLTGEGRDSPRLDVTALAFSPDGRRLAVGENRHISIVETQSGRWIKRLALDSSAVHLRWSDDGRTLTAVSSVAGGKRDDGTECDIYPSVTRWSD